MCNFGAPWAQCVSARDLITELRMRERLGPVPADPMRVTLASDASGQGQLSVRDFGGRSRGSRSRRRGLLCAARRPRREQGPGSMSFDLGTDTPALL